MTQIVGVSDKVAEENIWTYDTERDTEKKCERKEFHKDGCALG
jgi:hypothetical protein